MSDPSSRVAKAKMAPATDADEPRWGVPRKMIPEVSSTVSLASCPHNALQMLETGS